MNFLFVPNRMPLNKGNLKLIVRDVLKMIYYYKFEFIDPSFKEILPVKDFQELVDSSNVHIRDLSLILPLLSVAKFKKINRNEKISLEKYINDSLIYEMKFFNKSDKLNNPILFNDWFKSSLVKMYNNEPII